MPRLLEFLKWRLRYLRSEEETKAPSEQLQKAENRLARVVYGIRDRTDKSMVGCVTLVEQVENDKILDKGHEIKTPSAGNENDPTEVVETFGSANH